MSKILTTQDKEEGTLSLKNREKIKNYWHNQPCNFARYYKKPAKHFSIKNCITRFLNQRTQLLLSFVTCDKDASLLDLGCGTGTHLKLLAPFCKQVAGIDCSEQMLSEARKELESLEKSNWKLELGDAHSLPFPNQSFDWIIAMGFFDYVSSPRQVLLECHRVLKNSGFIVFGIPKRPTVFFFMRTRVGYFIKEKVFGLPPIGNILKKSELMKLLSDVGFHLCRLNTLWTTMWMVKAQKT